MRKPRLILCIAITALFTSGQAHAESVHSSWGGRDKGKHFVASAAAATAAGVATGFLNPPSNRFLTNFALGMIPGTVRELSQRDRSPQDMIWNAFGAASGAYFGSHIAIEPRLGPNGEIQGYTITYRRSL